MQMAEIQVLGTDTVLGRVSGSLQAPRPRLLESNPLWFPQMTKFDPTSTPRYSGDFATTVRSLEFWTANGAPTWLHSFSLLPLVGHLVIKFHNSRGNGENHGEVIQHTPVPSFNGKLRPLGVFHEPTPLMESFCPLPVYLLTPRFPPTTGRLP